MNGKRVFQTKHKAPAALAEIIVLNCCSVAGTVA